MEQAEIVILPGTKSTLDDLYHLRRSGLAQAIVRAHKAGKTVVGICGGFQMLGLTVDDPDGIDLLHEASVNMLATTKTIEKTIHNNFFMFLSPIKIFK